MEDMIHPFPTKERMEGAKEELDAELKAQFPDCGCRAEVDRLKAVVDRLAAVGPGAGPTVLAGTSAPTHTLAPGKEGRETAPQKKGRIIPEAPKEQGEKGTQEDQPPSQLDWEPESAAGTQGWKEESPPATGRKKKGRGDPDPTTEDTEQEDSKVRRVEPTDPQQP
ncbi:hypothetical protein EAI_12199 [Harpegnathos saltator]|uniref:Uncharacterized protein n=1 Tax=Harpegnathos saltator TaxID=610380 RepID=E2BXC7_HARSA|nr:hypothetical protein EAI_12199 [Harpegnathos saltator]